MTSVLVVDDSRFMRTVVGSALREEGFDVLEASNGRRAVAAVEEHEPDAVTMDVAMPEMDGIEATERIMEAEPTPILMLSAHTDAGADATLDALGKGAVDFLAKPGGEEVSIEAATLREPLVEKVRAVIAADIDAIDGFEWLEPNRLEPAEVGAGGAMSVSSNAFEPGTAASPGSAGVREPAGVAGRRPEEAYVDEPVVVVGASTGGPKLIAAIMRELPRALDARVLLVQHMPESFTGRFAERLDGVSDYEVREARNGEHIAGGEARLARGGRHLSVADGAGGRLELSVERTEPVNGVRPSIDVTMRSAAAAVDGPLVGVALTGMGSDGADGVRAIKEAGGATIVQDEATSPVFGIPAKAIETGCVDEVLPAAGLVDGVRRALARDGDGHG